MQTPTKVFSTFRSLGYLVRTGAEILRIISQSLIAPNRGRFHLAVFLNFCCRALSLLAFISSIQALQIAFQFVVSDGTKFKGKAIFDYLGVPPSYLPVITALVIICIFSLPSVIKAWETRLLQRCIATLHRLVETKTTLLPTDLFIVSHVPGYLNNSVQFLSGVMFLSVALCTIMVFRFDLFVLIVLASAAVVISVALSGARRINRHQDLVTLRADYIELARSAYQQDLGERKRRAPAEVPVHTGTERSAYFNAALFNWAKQNRANFNSSIIVGIAMGLIIWFVFTLEDLDSAQLVFLLFLIIAIRYAINTARDTGNMLTKLMEARTEMGNLKLLIAAQER